MDWWTLASTAQGGYAIPISAAVILGVAGCWRLSRRTSRDVHRRGAILRVGRRLQNCGTLSGGWKPGTVTLGGIAIRNEDETKHFKLMGTTGTGKSTAIRELLGAAIARGDRAIFADPDGGYRARFYNRFRGDVLLNPFESGSVRWDLFAEIRNSYDVEQLACGLIPACEDPSAGEWRGYARTFLSAVVRRCFESESHDLADLWRLLTTASIEELRPIVAGTPAQPFLEPDNSRMFGSIRSVTGSAIAALDHIRWQRAQAFSVRSWVRSRSSPGVLFIPYKAGQIAALRSMIATWMRLAIFEAMSQPEDIDQRLWIVVDELDALGAIDGLKDALARLRKFGCRCVLGVQSVAQVSSTYGQSAAQTIIENCGNTLILRCSGSENGGTSQFASRLIGDREIIRQQVSRGTDRGAALSTNGARRSRSIVEQIAMETVVLPAELEQLPDLRGYLKTASSAHWMKVAIRPSRNAPKRSLQKSA